MVLPLLLLNLFLKLPQLSASETAADVDWNKLFFSNEREGCLTQPSHHLPSIHAISALRYKIDSVS